MKKFILIALLATCFSQANAQSCIPFYADYSAANFDDLYYQWVMNSRPAITDSVVNEAAVVFTTNPLSGYEDPTEIWNTLNEFNNIGYYVDTISAIVTHENNSGQTDTIVMYAYGVNGNGTPNLSNLLWSDTTFTNVTLSPGGNYMGMYAAFVISYTPHLYVNLQSDVAFGVRYLGSPLDTFSLIAGSVDNGNGGTDMQSNYQNSYVKMLPYIPNWTKNANIGYGNPVGSSGWFEAQNWAIYGYTCRDNNFNPDVISDICRVTIDSTGQHWKVIWSKGSSPLIASFEPAVIYSGVPGFSSGTTQAYANFSTWVDTLYNVADVDFVTLFVKDNLGNLLYSAPSHRPIYLSITDSASHSHITYNQYEGASYNYMRVYRGTSLGNMVLFDSIPYNPANDPYYVLIDNEANSYGNYYYQMEAVFNTGCYPSLPAEGDGGDAEKILTKSFSRSNIAHLSTVGLSEEQALLNSISIYPNPAQNNLTINLGKTSAEGATIEVLNMLGQVVKTNGFNKAAGQQLTVDMSDLATGLYFVQIQAFGGTKAFRIVKN